MCEKKKDRSIIPKEPSEPLGAPVFENKEEIVSDEEENKYYSLGGDNDLTEPEEDEYEY